MFEDLKKKQREGLPTGTGGVLGLFHVSDPKRRVYVMLGFLAVLIGAMIQLRIVARGPQEPPGSGRAPSEEVPTGPPAYIGVPELDQALAERVMDAEPKARRLWEHEAIPYLILEARHTPSIHDHNRNLLPIDAQSAKVIVENAAPWRFKFVRFRGKLEYIEEIDYDEVYQNANIGRVHRGRVLISDGESPVRVTFVTPAMPTYYDLNEIEPRLQMIEDGWVRGRGIFVKNYLERHGGEEEVPVLLLVGTRIERDYEIQPVDELADVDFQIIDDDPSIA